jgi:hypothetical protein
MPVRSVTLNASKAGMTRLRDKGGASPETLYELTNAYINASRSPTQRPGTTWAYQFGANTHGLVAFQGIFYAFTDNPASVVNTGNYRVFLLRNPVAGSAATLSKVTYAVPFMGYSDGTAHHFWLQNPSAWTANTIYSTNSLVQPTTPNGYYYRALPSNNPPVWQPRTAYISGSYCQPSKYNGFYYQVTNITIPALAPYSGPNEPAWSTSLGGITMDFSAGNPSTNPIQVNNPPSPPPAQPPGGGVGGRYGNRGGNGPNNGVTQ